MYCSIAASSFQCDKRSIKSAVEMWNKSGKWKTRKANDYLHVSCPHREQTITEDATTCVARIRTLSQSQDAFWTKSDVINQMSKKKTELRKPGASLWAAHSQVRLPRSWLEGWWWRYHWIRSGHRHHSTKDFFWGGGMIAPGGTWPDTIITPPHFHTHTHTYNCEKKRSGPKKTRNSLLPTRVKWVSLEHLQASITKGSSSSCTPTPML